MTFPVVLSIAGSDNCAGAGIQADLKTCEALGVYCTTALTAVTAQNPFGVKRVLPVDENMLRDQLETIAEAVRPDAVKIGMLPGPSAVRTIADFLDRHHMNKVVLDPVLAATSGGSLSGAKNETLAAMVEQLFPYVSLLTPNIPEMKALLANISDNVDPSDDVTDAGVQAYMECVGLNALLLKGGHSDSGYCVDKLFVKGDGKIDMFTFSSERIETNNTHGTGCTLSSAIACGLAKGSGLVQAVAMAKAYVRTCLQNAAGCVLSPVNGPLIHRTAQG